MSENLKAADLFYECPFAGNDIFFRTALGIFQFLTFLPGSRCIFKHEFHIYLGKKGSFVCLGFLACFVLVLFCFPQKKIRWSASHLACTDKFQSCFT